MCQNKTRYHLKHPGYNSIHNAGVRFSSDILPHPLSQVKMEAMNNKLVKAGKNASWWLSLLSWNATFTLPIVKSSN